MAGTATFSSTFSFTVVPSDTNATTITVPPTLAYRVLSVGANNTTAGPLNVTVTIGGVTAITDGAQAIAANSYGHAELNAANLNVAAGQTLVVTASGTGLTPISINCVATSGGASLPAV